MTDIQIKAENGIVFVAPSGRLDTAAARDFERRVGIALKGADAMVMDLSAVTYISSLGLRVALFAAKTLSEAGGRFAIAEPPDHILDVFRLAGFTSILKIFDSVDAAAENVSSPGG